MTQSEQFAVVIDSIGTASPGQAVAVARGLGLSPDQTLRAIYRAPVVLASALSGPAARTLCELLSSLGFQNHLTDGTAANVLPEPVLLDVALHVEEPVHTLPVAAELAKFCGVEVAEALRLITDPPGIVLGGVTQASVDALHRRVAHMGATLTASNPLAARFDLFATGLPATVAAQLRRELAEAEHGLLEGDTLIATGLPHPLADRLWRKYGRSGSVRMIDQAFLRFDLVLDGLLPGETVRGSHAELLIGMFGMPAELFDTVMAEPPVTLATHLAYGTFEGSLAQLAAAGLSARAVLATFTPLALEVGSAQDSQAVAAELALLGLIDGPVTLPFVTPAMAPALARMARARIEAAGGEVFLADCAA